MLELIRISHEGWRERVLVLVLRACMLLGLLVYFPSVLVAAGEEQWPVVVVDSVAMMGVIVLDRASKVPFHWRASSFTLIFYLLALTLILLVGPIGMVYLICFSLMTTLLLGLRLGLVSLGINALTLLLVGILPKAGLTIQLAGLGHAGFAWVVIAFNFFFVNTLLVLCVGMVIATLESARKNLLASNRRLEEESLERKQAEDSLQTIKTTLYESQKLEAIGRLAGGIAHDFNNMLAVIVGNAELMQSSVEEDSPLVENLGEILNAGERSANLTRQLLAFARKQAIAPRLLDLNKTLENMLGMLKRLVGESIVLHWQPSEEQAMVKMDPAQLDQILVNLVINARDAIRTRGDHGGIGIEVRKGMGTSFEGSKEDDFRAVCLSVSDNGCGMTSEVQDQIFEPFFTTKPQGQGTGLGLATVYGIVQQNKGSMTVDSKVDQGSTFTLYFPEQTGGEQDQLCKTSSTTSLRGTETILLVEDEPALLMLCKRHLQKLGYEVLSAERPSKAIEISQEWKGPLQLLLTDVVMPEMSGRALWNELSSSRPHMKCLYMSGYTADIIAHHGVLEEGIQFLEKPFSAGDLASKVRLALGDS